MGDCDEAIVKIKKAIELAPDSEYFQEQLAKFEANLLQHTMLHEDLRRFFDGFPRDAHPMAVMVGVLSVVFGIVLFVYAIGLQAGGRFVRTLRRNGAARVLCCATHAVFSPPATERLITSTPSRKLPSSCGTASVNTQFCAQVIRPAGPSVCAASRAKRWCPASSPRCGQLKVLSPAGP